MKNKSGRGIRIDADVRRAIAGEPSTLTHAEVARKYGVSDVSVRKIRMTIMVPRQKAAPEASANAAPSPMAAITLQVPVQTLDAWWTGLDNDAKAAIFTANYRFQIEGFVS